MPINQNLLKIIREPQGVQGPQGPQGVQGPQGPKGDIGGSYAHAQSSASSQWVVTHNLGYNPNVTIVDSAGSKIIGETQYNSINQTTLTFTSSFAGNAYFS